MIVAVSCGIHAFNLRTDLPTPEPDEPWFVLPAVQMATNGDPNPHWFGHPGSTVIVPLAAAFRASDIVLHNGPVFGPAPLLASRFRADPTPFYLLARIWSAAFGVGAVVLVFLLGRKVFGRWQGLAGAAVWALVPIGIQWGRVARTDSVGLFFALLTLLLAVRALERPSTRRFALVGVALGLAVSSRYLMIALVPAIMFAWISSGEGRRPPVRSLFATFGAALGAFAVMTPFFFLDPAAVRRSIAAETTGTVTNNGHSWSSNLVAYLVDIVPQALSWPAVIAALVGVVLAIRSRNRGAITLLFFGASLLALISTSPLQWPRWTIQMLPIVVLFAVDAVFTLSHKVSDRIEAHWRVLDRRVTAAAMAFGLLVVAIGPLQTTSRETWLRAQPTTRDLTQRWFRAQVPRGTPVAIELKSPDLRYVGYPVVDRWTLSDCLTLDGFLANGVNYFVINDHVRRAYLKDRRRRPAEAAFYDSLSDRGLLLARFAPRGIRRGPTLLVYRVERTEPTTDEEVVPAPRMPCRCAINCRPRYPVGASLVSARPDIGNWAPGLLRS